MFFFLPPYCFCVDSPPPCVFFSRLRRLSPLRDGTDVNCVADRCASSLRNHGFLRLQLHFNSTARPTGLLLNQTLGRDLCNTRGESFQPPQDQRVNPPTSS